MSTGVTGATSHYLERHNQENPVPERYVLFKSNATFTSNRSSPEYRRPLNGPADVRFVRIMVDEIASFSTLAEDRMAK